MKKILISLLVLACCAPAMAATTVDAVGGAGTITITVTVTDDDVVRGLAVAVEQTDSDPGDGKLAAGTDVSAADFNTYIDYAVSYPTGYDVGMTGQHAAARVGEAGAIDDTTLGSLLPAADFVVSAGYLDQSENQGGLDASGSPYVITIDLTGTAATDFDVSLDGLRGGVVGDDLEVSGNVSTGTTVTVTFVTDCVKSDAPFYAEWVGAGKNWEKPDCWCYERQCRGDVDGVKVGLYWVQTNDLTTFAAAFNKADLKLDQTLICADLDHKKVGLYRCQTNDLTIFASYFNKAQLKVPVCPKDWDGDSDDDYNFWITVP